MTTVLKGGAKLDAFLRGVARKLRASEVKVGFLEGATYPDGQSVATVAAIQNFGAPAAGIPPRPFFTNTITRNSGAWPKMVAGALRVSDFDSAKALGLVGEQIAGQMRQEIEDMTAPPLSPVTLMLRKMRDGRRDEPVTFAMLQEARRRVAAGENPGVTGTWAKPLVDTGNLLASIGVEVDGVGVAEANGGALA